MTADELKARRKRARKKGKHAPCACGCGTKGLCAAEIKARASKLTRGPGGKLTSARSKTGRTECSQAMSDWKTKGMSPTVAATLGKCRAIARRNKMGADARTAGNEARAQHHEHVARSGGPITAKDRLARARELRAHRNQYGDRASGVAAAHDVGHRLGAKVAPNRMEGMIARERAAKQGRKDAAARGTGTRQANRAKRDAEALAAYRREQETRQTVIDTARSVNPMVKRGSRQSAYRPAAGTPKFEAAVGQARSALQHARQLRAERAQRQTAGLQAPPPARPQAIGDRAGRGTAERLAKAKELRRERVASASKPFSGYHGAPKQVTFKQGEYRGVVGTIHGQVQKRYSAEADTFHIQLRGFGKPGGWSGKITATPDQLLDYTGVAARRPVRQSPAPTLREQAAVARASGRGTDERARAAADLLAIRKKHRATMGGDGVRGLRLRNDAKQGLDLPKRKGETYQARSRRESNVQDVLSRIQSRRSARIDRDEDAQLALSGKRDAARLAAERRRMGRELTTEERRARARIASGVRAQRSVGGDYEGARVSAVPISAQLERARNILNRRRRRSA